MLFCGKSKREKIVAILRHAASSSGSSAGSLGRRSILKKKRRECYSRAMEDLDSGASGSVHKRVKYNDRREWTSV